jgi:hypothetical protein
MQPGRGDVVRSSDPFKLGTDSQRPWLVVNNESHPFGDEQCLAVAISTKEYDDSIALDPTVWDVGGVPQESFVSPWAVHSPGFEDLVAWQGRVTDEFVTTVVDATVSYLE